MRGLSVTKNLKEIKFEGVWGQLESKKGFSGTIAYKLIETNSSFHVK